jgi:hypothetical protein
VPPSTSTKSVGPRRAGPLRAWAASCSGWAASCSDGVWRAGADSAGVLRRKVGAQCRALLPIGCRRRASKSPCYLHRSRPRRSVGPPLAPRSTSSDGCGTAGARGERGAATRLPSSNSSAAVTVRHIGAAAPLFVSSKQWSSACRGVPSCRSTMHARPPLSTRSGILLHKISTSPSLSMYPACFAAPHYCSPFQTLERSSICSFSPFGYGRKNVPFP